MRDRSSGPDEPAGWVSPDYLGGRLPGNHPARLTSTVIVGLGHQGAEEELVDDRPQGGDADERIGAVIDAGEAIVADVLQAGPAEGEHEPVGRLDRNLAVLDAVDQDAAGVLVDLI